MERAKYKKSRNNKNEQSRDSSPISAYFETLVEKLGNSRDTSEALEIAHYRERMTNPYLVKNSLRRYCQYKKIYKPKLTE